MKPKGLESNKVITSLRYKTTILNLTDMFQQKPTFFNANQELRLMFKFASPVTFVLKKGEVSADTCLLNSKSFFYIGNFLKPEFFAFV